MRALLPLNLMLAPLRVADPSAANALPPEPVSITQPAPAPLVANGLTVAASLRLGGLNDDLVTGTDVELGFRAGPIATGLVNRFSLRSGEDEDSLGAFASLYLPASHRQRQHHLMLQLQRRPDVDGRRYGVASYGWLMPGNGGYTATEVGLYAELGGARVGKGLYVKFQLTGWFATLPALIIPTTFPYDNDRIR